MGSKYAIECEEVCLSFDRPILRDLCLHVPYNYIYGFIGRSGCGKTTLIRCVWGFLKPHKGSIKTLGLIPDAVEGLTGMPGPSIGYMPQDACIDEFMTVKETLTFFAKNFGMSEKITQSKIQELEKLIILPDLDSKVGDLSGGEKRRLSFACSIIHGPQLLLLDEPTVGSDPVARNAIWDYLLNLKSQGTTVFITTHYIDELVNSDIIGVMKNGKIDMELNPSHVRATFPLISLGQAFCEIWRSNNGQLIKQSVHRSNNDKVSSNKKKNSISELTFVKKLKLERNDAIFNRLKIVTKRTTILPLIVGIITIMLAFFLFTQVYGIFPKDLLQIGFVKSSKVHSFSNFSNTSPLTSIKLVEYEDECEAYEDTKKRKLQGFLVFSDDYDLSLIEWVDCLFKRNIRCAKIRQPFVRYSGDFSNKIISTFIDGILRETMQNFLKDYFISVNVSHTALQFFETEPILGEQISSGRNQMKASQQNLSWRSLFHFIYIGSIFVFAPFLCNDEKYGFIERLMAMGNTRRRIFKSYFTWIFFVNFMFACTNYFLISTVFHLQKKAGSSFPLIVITIEVATSTMLLFVMVRRAPQLSVIVTASFVMIIGGFSVGKILWPEEALPYYAKWFPYLFQTSFAGDAIVAIMIRGLHPLSLPVLKSFGGVVTHFIIATMIFSYEMYK